MSFSLTGTVRKAKVASLYECLSTSIILVNNYASLHGVFWDSDYKLRIQFPSNSRNCAFKLLNKREDVVLEGELPVPNEGFRTGFMGLVEAKKDIKNDEEYLFQFKKNSTMGICIYNTNYITKAVISDWETEKSKLWIDVSDKTVTDSSGNVNVIKSAKIEK